MIWVKVMVPHDHMERYAIVELADTPDLRRRVEKGFLLPVEVTNERGNRLPTRRDDPNRV